MTVPKTGSIRIAPDCSRPLAAPLRGWPKEAQQAGWRLGKAGCLIRHPYPITVAGTPILPAKDRERAKYRDRAKAKAKAKATPMVKTTGPALQGRVGQVGRTRGAARLPPCPVGKRPAAVHPWVATAAVAIPLDRAVTPQAAQDKRVHRRAVAQAKLLLAGVRKQFREAAWVPLRRALLTPQDEVGKTGTAYMMKRVCKPPPARWHAPKCVLKGHGAPQTPAFQSSARV